jgi:hypothetical protein
MEHGSHLVDILDAEGNIVGQKKRADIDKTRDNHHAIFTVMITPRGELVLSCIPSRDDLPNIYAQKLGPTVSTIRRHGELPEKAALRAVSRELFIDDAQVNFLGEGLFSYDNGRCCLETTFYIVGDAPTTYSQTDADGFVTMTTKQLKRDIEEHQDHFAPTLINLWKEFGNKLPV